MLQRWQAARQTRGRTGPRVRSHDELVTWFTPGDVCISLLAAEIPATVRSQLARHDTLWMHYEYLTAEPWARGCHTLPSPAPGDGQVTWYYFPGFTKDSGGLLREHDLAGRRKRFGPEQQQQWLAAHHLLPKHSGNNNNSLRVCLFGYPDQPLQTLLDALRTCEQPIHLLLHDKLYQQLGEPADSPGLAISRHGWLDQEDFDHLLWSCDVNVVRGEESWVRAHWAQRPFIWQPYRQKEDAHIAKLNAFISDLLGPDAGSKAGDAIAGLAAALSPPDNQADATRMHLALGNYLACLPAIGQIHERRSRQLLAQDTAVDRIRQFIADQLQ